MTNKKPTRSVQKVKKASTVKGKALKKIEEEQVSVPKPFTISKRVVLSRRAALPMRRALSNRVSTHAQPKKRAQLKSKTPTQSQFTRQDSKELLLHAAVENRHHYLLSCGFTAGGQYHDGDDVKWTYTGTPVMNQIFAVNAPEEEIAARLSEWNARFRGFQAAPTWLLTPLDRPSNLREHLLRNGYAHTSDFYGMVLHLKNVPREHTNPSSFEARKITDRPGMSLWSQVACHGFHIPPEMRGVFSKVMTDSGLNERYKHHHYLCYHQGKPVATVTLLPEGSNVGVYWVSTVPEARRHGIAKAMMIHVLRQAQKEFGVKTATLQSTEMGHEFYKRIGFEDLYVENVYEWRG
jgi:GNAT superfamily N-acetyltransferase